MLFGRNYLMEDKENQESDTELCFSIIKDAYNQSFKNKENLDGKAEKIIIFSGIIVSLYSGIGGIILQAAPEKEYIYLNKYYILLIILMIGLSLLIAAIIFALKAYKPESWQIVPDPRTFLEKYAKSKKTKEEILGPLTSTMVKTIEYNKGNIKAKVENIDKSFKLLIAGIVTSIIFTFSILIM